MIEVLKQAMEALEFGLHVGFDESSESQIKKGGKAFDQHNKAIASLNQAIAELESQEPVAWMVWGENNVPALTFTKPADKYVFDALYTHPPQRTWVGLTEQEAAECWSSSTVRTWQSIEAKLKEKNT